MGRAGSIIAKSLIGRSPADREKIVLGAIRNGEVPRRLSDRSRWCHVATAGGRLVLTVSCRQVEVGTDDDAFLAPMRPETAQAVADHFGAILPSRLIVDHIWRAAEFRLPIAPPPGFKIPGPAMLDPRSWIAASNRIETALQAHAGARLVAGGKKDIVVGPQLDGSHVAIYSTPFSGAGALRVIGNHQPYSTIHTPDHVDYSHGARLVQRTALLDGLPVDLVALSQDPNPARRGLVSDQGPFAPRFPSVVGGRVRMALEVDADPSRRVPRADPPPFRPARSSHSGPILGPGLGAGAALALGAGLSAGGAIVLGLPLPLLIGASAAGALVAHRLAA